VPAPFGFGLWTAHFSPGVLGAPTVVAARFDVERAPCAAIAEHRVSVLACVSTQFIMMLNSPLLDELDLSSLRVMFTGGEAVPYARAAAFEDRTGAKVLQFYGSNETGALSRTAHRLPGAPVRRRRAGSSTPCRCGSTTTRRSAGDRSATGRDPGLQGPGHLCRVPRRRRRQRSSCSPTTAGC
jgi:acyl-CoA synthetase